MPYICLWWYSTSGTRTHLALGEKLSRQGFIPDSPSQNCLSAVVLNTRIGKQVTWLCMTTSSTTPPDNVFLHLWLFHIFIEYVHSTVVRSVSLTSRSQRKACHRLSLCFAIRSARQNHVYPPPEGIFDINLHLHMPNITVLRDLRCAVVTTDVYYFKLDQFFIFWFLWSNQTLH